MKLKFRNQLSSKQLRQQKVTALKEELQQASSLVLFSSESVSHQDFERFRQALDKTSAKLRFVKNTLFKIAAESLKLPKELYEPSVLTGPTSAIYILSDDFISTIKVLSDQFGKQKNVKVKIAFLDKEVYSSSQVLEFAKIPSVQELHQKLAYLVNNPIQSLHSSLHDNLGKLARSLQAVIDKGMSN
jgi:ribosomal protein L10